MKAMLESADEGRQAHLFGQKPGRVRLVMAVGFCAWVSLAVAQAQTSNVVSRTPANRYLLVVECSHPMQKRTEGTAQVVGDLFRSGMGGQLRPGDSIGVWTYNEELVGGRFPLQEWSSNSQQIVTARVLGFLKEQKCEKQPRLEKVLPALRRVLTGSEFITVVLISSGAGEMRGTPFDAEINKTYKSWRNQQQDTRMPFITVLRACRGQMTHYSVNPAPWEVQLPPLPQELLVVRAPPKAAPAVVKPKPATPPPVPPLIISGKKPEPVAAVERADKTPAVAELPRTNTPVSTSQAAVPAALQPTNLPAVQALAAVPEKAPEAASRQDPVTNVTAGLTSTPPGEQIVAVKPAAKRAADGSGQDAGPETGLVPASVSPASISPHREQPGDEAKGVGASTVAPAAWPAFGPLPAVDSGAGFLPRKAWAGLAASAVAMLALLGFWRARSHRAAHVSLITRSLQRGKP